MQIKLPELSGSGSDAVITMWHVPAEGYVAKDDDLLEVVTDKATFDIPAPESGRLVKILKAKGEKVFPGDVLAEIEENRDR